MIEAAADGAGEPRQPPPATPPPAPAGAPPVAPPPAMLDALRGGLFGNTDFARFDGELDSEMGRQFEVTTFFAVFRNKVLSGNRKANSPEVPCWPDPKAQLHNLL